VHPDVLLHWPTLVHCRAVQHDANKDVAVLRAILKALDTDGNPIVILRSVPIVTRYRRGPGTPIPLRTIAPVVFRSARGMRY
jgi:hypothetical protein